MNDTVTVTKLGLNVIKPPAWNSRIAPQPKTDDAARLAALAADIKARGLQSPIEVEGPAEDGSYEIVYGTRRVAACKMAGLTEIAAIVRPMSTAAERMIRNVRENMQREDLSTFEQARAIVALRGQGLKLAEVASLVGLSVPRVSNLCVTFEGLHPDIREAWAKRQPATNTDFLRELASVKDPAVQLKTYDDEVRRITTAVADGSRTPTGRAKKGEGSSTAGIRVIPYNFQGLLDVAKSTRTPDVIGDGGHVIVSKRWLRHCVDWLCGQTKTAPPGIITPTAPKDGEKAAKAAKKAKPAVTVVKGAK